MKKIIFLFVLFCLTISAKTQTSVYHPMPDSNAVWCEDYNYTDGSSVYNYHYAQFIHGDSIIGNNSYHKLFRTGWVYSSYYGGSNYFNQFTGLIRQDIAHKKVYTWSNNGDTLLYDFNLSLHDTLSPTYINDQVINYICYIDSIFVDNNYRKRFWLCTNTGSSDSAYVALIEGEGSTFGLMTTKLAPPFEAYGTLNGFSDTVYYYKAPAFCGITVGIQEIKQTTPLEVYPNPTADKITIINHQKSIIRIIDIQGQTILQFELQQDKTDIDISGLAKGVYILRLISNDKTGVSKFIKE
jgi:hypothetical protein